MIHLYLARDLEVTCQATEPGEVLEVHWVGLASAVDRAHAGDIVDAKSVIGLLRADRWLQDDLRR